MKNYDDYPVFEKILRNYRQKSYEKQDDRFDFLPGDVYGAMDREFYSMTKENPDRTIKEHLRPGLQLYPTHPNQKEIFVLPGTSKKRDAEESLEVKKEEGATKKDTYFIYRLGMMLLKSKVIRYFGSISREKLEIARNRYEQFLLESDQ